MSRSPGSNKKLVTMRESLECAVAGMVRIEYLLRITRLRMVQVRTRFGLGELVNPAIVELDDVVGAARTAKKHINTALTQLAGGD